MRRVEYGPTPVFFKNEEGVVAQCFGAIALDDTSRLRESADRQTSNNSSAESSDVFCKQRFNHSAMLADRPGLTAQPPWSGQHSRTIEVQYAHVQTPFMAADYRAHRLDGIGGRGAIAANQSTIDAS